MKEYAKKEELLTQSRRMLIPSYFLENGTIITPLLLLYLDSGAGLQKKLTPCVIHSDEVLH